MMNEKTSCDELLASKCETVLRDVTEALMEFLPMEDPSEYVRRAYAALLSMTTLTILPGLFEAVEEICGEPVVPEGRAEYAGRETIEHVQDFLDWARKQIEEAEGENDA